MSIRRTNARVGWLLTVFAILPLSSAADDALNGAGWVRGRIQAERALVIGDALYRVSPRTTLRGLEGEPLRFEELSDVVAVESFVLAPRRAVTWARFDATEVRGQLVLNWLELSNEHEGADTGRDPAYR